MLYLLKKVWKYAESDRYRLIICYGLHVLSIGGKLLQPFAFGMAINVLQEQGINHLGPVYRWLGIYVLGFFTFQICHHTGRYFEVTTALRNQKRFNHRLYLKLCSLSMQWHSDHHSGDIVNRIKGGGEALKDFSVNQSKYMDLILSSIVPILVFTRMNMGITIITVSLISINLTIIMKMNKRIEGILGDIHEYYHGLAAKLTDYAMNVVTIITLKLKKQTDKQLNHMYEEYYIQQMREFRINQPRCFLIAFGGILTEVVVIVFYLLSQTSSGEAFLIGNLVMLITYFREMSHSIFELVSNFYDTLNWKTAIASTDIILDEPSYESYNANEKLGPWHSIRIEHIAFQYGAEGSNITWHDVTLEAGKKIAIVGSSGSGKSTILHLLASLYEADATAIWVDDKKYTNLNAIHHDMGLISQESEIFDDTVLHNITFGLDVDQHVLEEVMVIAALDQVIKDLPDGIHTSIKEKGINLSGGQKQRLALARGLYFAQNKRILLLDEITSNVDVVNEAHMMTHIMKAYRDRCIICSIHRLHLLELFDEVLVMNEGSIVDRGSFQELVRREGCFQTLWETYQLETK
ncbi:ABC transporter ATP-binding protein [Vallitalea pronyensis]|uniref:ABC transporter ATP-binding protein n=1 Tax=Vallitalea pronyensis TaxID=1348613 RepID=A0A8J8MJY4_9FIRM|nr:ABC transporter ATP-binding protein [Vallitalea pronyensis]QUI22792.1 ABC transporter ATP-binding protein [Vallitalea pronyensis]